MEQHHKKIVSVIVVTFNSQTTLTAALDSLKKTDNFKQIELIIIDNNSDDQSLSIVNDIFPDAKLIKNNSNSGFAKACNQGASAASGKYLLFYNPDLMIDKNSISQLLTAYENLDKPGLIGGRMRYADNSFQATCRKFPTLSNLIFSRGSAFSTFIKDEENYTLPEYSQTTEVDAIAGAYIMIEKNLFLSIGGFDERFFMFMEDTDLCLRLKRSGYKNYFAPNAGGVHLWKKGSRTGKLKRLYYHHISVFKYFRKHFPNSFSLFILPPLLLLNYIFKMIIPGRK